MGFLDRLPRRLRPAPTQAPALPTSEVEIGQVVEPDLSTVPISFHRRAIDEALLERDRLWLKRLRGLEPQIMFPWQGPVTALIRTTEREIAEKERKLGSL